MPSPIERGKVDVVTTPTGAGSAAATPTGAGDAFRALGDVGKQLEEIGVQAAKPEVEARGAESVQRDENGELMVKLRTPLNSLDEAYNHGAVAAYTSQTESDRRLKLQSLANENFDDPEKFRVAADTFVRDQSSKAPLVVRYDLLNNGRSEIAQYTGRLVDDKRSRDTQTQRAAIESDIRAIADTELLPLARSQGTHTPEFEAAVAKFQNKYDALRNPIFKKSADEIQNEITNTLARGQAEAGLGTALKILQTGGADAALKAGDAIFYSRDLALPLDTADAYHNQLHRQVDDFEREQREAQAAKAHAVEDTVKDAEALAANGGNWERIISRTELHEALGDKASDVVEHLDWTADVAHQTSSVAAATPAQIEARARELDPNRLDLPPSRFTVGGNVPGLLTPGNIDLTRRPEVKNADGTVSTVRSISITQDGKAILLPTVIGDRVVSNDEAIDHWRKSGENLGTFATEGDANAYAEALHQQQAARGVRAYGYAADVRRFNAFTTAVEQRRTALAGDPAAFVAMTSKYVQGLAQQAQAGNVDAHARYVGALLAEQARLGVPADKRRILSKDQEEAVTAQLTSGNADAATSTLRSITAGLPADALAIISKQIAPKNRAVAVAISAARENPTMASDILIGNRFLDQNPDAKPNEKEISSVVDRLTGGAPGWLSSTGGLFQFAPDARSNTVAAAQALYARQQIGGKPGTFDPSKFEDSVRKVLGNPITFRGQIIVPPHPEMRANDLTDLMRRIDDKAIKQFGNGTPLDASGRAIPASAIAKDGVLTFSGAPGVYRIMFPGQGHLGVAGASGARTFMLDLGRMVGGTERVAPPPPLAPLVLPPVKSLPKKRPRAAGASNFMTAP